MADSFRANENFSVKGIITELGMGEALVSSLDENGTPTPVERTLMSPPCSAIGPISDDARATQISRSPTRTKYATSVNRESAHEMLAKRAEQAAAQAAELEESAELEQKARPTKARASNRQSVGESFMKSISRAIGSQIGRQLVRGVLGSLFKK